MNRTMPNKHTKKTHLPDKNGWMDIASAPKDGTWTIKEEMCDKYSLELVL